MKLIVFLIYSWENWDWEKSSRLPRMMTDVRAGSQTPVSQSASTTKSEISQRLHETTSHFIFLNALSHSVHSKSVSIHESHFIGNRPRRAIFFFFCNSASFLFVKYMASLIEKVTSSDPLNQLINSSTYNPNQEPPHCAYPWQGTGWDSRQRKWEERASTGWH